MAFILFLAIMVGSRATHSTAVREAAITQAKNNQPPLVPPQGITNQVVDILLHPGLLQVS